MIRESVTIDDVIQVLNRALEADREAITSMVINHRAPCNEALADDESIQVGTGEDGLSVGLLGIINGFFGTHEKSGYGTIQAVLGEGGSVECFTRFIEEEDLLDPAYYPHGTEIQLQSV